MIIKLINEMKNGIDAEKMTKENYLESEAKLVEAMSTYVIGTEVAGKLYGTGKITKAEGATLENLIVEVTFAECTKRYSLMHILTNTRFVKLVDSIDIENVWSLAFELHTDLTTAYRSYEQSARLLAIEAEKKVEADKKAEEKYQRLRTKAIKDFDELINKPTIQSETNDFYFALGWLAKHIGSMTAILPDYLGSAFERHFGIETPKTLVDSRAKTSGGYAKQWSWEFKCSIKKLKDTVVPACIQNVTTDFSKGIHNTAFLWDLIDNYGFQFGKEQDIDKIAETIPAKYMSSFNQGLIA